MKIIIKRYRKKSTCTEQGRSETIDGRLSIEGMYVCDCAENAIMSLPTGKYSVSIKKCHHHARKMPVILLHENITPNCDDCKALECVNSNTCMPCYCPMLKAGNGIYHRTDGSIIVGKYLAPGCLTRPKDTFDYIYERIRKNIERGNEVTLEIIEDYPESKELTNFEIGTQILAQMGGKPINI